MSLPSSRLFWFLSTMETHMQPNNYIFPSPFSFPPVHERISGSLQMGISFIDGKDLVPLCAKVSRPCKSWGQQNMGSLWKQGSSEPAQRKHVECGFLKLQMPSVFVIVLSVLESTISPPPRSYSKIAVQFRKHLIITAISLAPLKMHFLSQTIYGAGKTGLLAWGEQWWNISRCKVLSFADFMEIRMCKQHIIR